MQYGSALTMPIPAILFLAIHSSFLQETLTKKITVNPQKRLLFPPSFFSPPLCNAEWKQLEKELEFKAVYSSPDRKEEAHYAERSVGIMEVTIKAMLLERDLPHSWWRYCAESAVLLLNRFPILSQLSTMPADGDQARPLEVVTKGQYSRRQIDRELSYFVAVGTPVLVHDPQVKGSQLTPKSSWWVVQGMYREQLVLWSPFTDSLTHAVRKSKSYTAFKLARGLSYNKFLSLNEAPPSKRQTQIPTDFDEISWKSFLLNRFNNKLTTNKRVIE